MKKLIYLLTLLLISFNLQATTYYIDPSGNDTSGDGSIGNPWKTLYKACNTVTSGHTIHVNAGTYTENSQIVLPAGVNLEGDGETSIITSSSFGTEGQYLINATSATLNSTGQTISYLKFDGNNYTVAQCFYILKRNNVKIHHCTFVNWKYQAIIWSGDGTGDIGADPYANPTYPTAYVTGSEFYNNTMTSCSVYDSYGHGALCIGGQQGMLIHDNVINNATRGSGNPGYCIKTQYPAFIKGAKIYNNTLTTANNAWLFAIEGFFFYGVEIYDNTIIGAIDINFISKDTYDYGAWIHNNTIGPATATAGYTGCILEFNTSDVIIEKNMFRNNANGITFTPRTGNTVQDYRISYNIFRDAPSGAYQISGGTAEATIYFDDMFFYNNVFHGAPIWGLSLFGTWTDFTFENNIFTGATWYWCGLRQNAATNVYIRNNILYNNANSNGVQLQNTPTNYVNSGNINSSPLYTNEGSDDFTLQSGSPAKDAGLSNGLTTDYLDYTVPFNTIQDIGAYEYGSSPAGESSENDILTFTLAAQTGAATINATNHTVSIEVVYGTSVTSLSPTITVSAGATVSPTSGTAQNFTSPGVYTVTAEDLTEQQWTVTVTVDESPSSDSVLVTDGTNVFIDDDGNLIII